MVHLYYKMSLKHCQGTMQGMAYKGKEREIYAFSARNTTTFPNFHTDGVCYECSAILKAERSSSHTGPGAKVQQ